MSDPSPATAAPLKPYTASARQIYSWAAGGVTMHLLITLYGQAMKLLTLGLGLSALVVSLSMMLPRVVDALADPILGHLSDNTHTRWGRRKPFLIIGSSLGCLFLFLLWWGDKEWSGTAQLIYLTVVGTLFYTSWGLYSMAYTALGYELTDDYNERSKIAGIAGIVTSIILLLNGGVFWFTLRPLFYHGLIPTLRDLTSHGFDWAHINAVLKTAFTTVPGQPTNEINGIRWVTGIAVLVAMTAAIITAKGCKERFVKANTSHPSSIGTALKATLKNRPFLNLMIYKLCQLLGERVFQGLLLFIGTYFVCVGDKARYSQMDFWGGVGCAIIIIFLMPFLKAFSMKLGKRAGLILPSSAAVLLLLAQPLLLRENQPVLLLVPLLMLPLLSIISTTLMNAIVPDICDMDELEHGERREGLFTAVVAFMNKLEISLAFFIVGLLVKLAGVDEKTLHQSPEVLQRLLWIAIGMGVLFTIGALVASFKFKMDEAMMDDIRRQLEARRQAKSLAAEENAPDSAA